MESLYYYLCKNLWIVSPFIIYYGWKKMGVKHNYDIFLLYIISGGLLLIGEFVYWIDWSKNAGAVLTDLGTWGCFFAWGYNVAIDNFEKRLRSIIYNLEGDSEMKIEKLTSTSMKWNSFGQVENIISEINYDRRAKAKI